MSLFIDLDNTLYSSKFAYKFALDNLNKIWYKKYKNRNFKLFYEKAREVTKEQLKNHSSNRLRILYFKKVFEYTNGIVSIEESLEFEKLYYKYFQLGIKEFYKKNIKDYKELFLILREIAKKETIFILTNENLRTQLIKLQAFFPKFPIQLITSEEVGKEKPSKEFFNYALKKTTSYSSDTFMIGDNLVDDIEGAIKSKINAIHIESIFGNRDYVKVKDLKNKKYIATKSILTALYCYLEYIDPENDEN